uniref:Uncharacterized protein n=1 Tax=Panagrolaimus sp. PS1159 TaxID=55785 RepID=A0AC35EZS7_9BILA
MAVNIQMANTSFDAYGNMNDSASTAEHSDTKKSSSGAFENAFSVFRRNPSKTSETKEDENAKRTLFGKILKILSLKVSESKANEKVRKQCLRKQCRQRRRSSASSSSFHPMPTIYEEENESDFYGIQSTTFNPNANHSIMTAVA